ncbi:hypothetical protein SHIRM173S_06477 [Streptomyces hirsutus]
MAFETLTMTGRKRKTLTRQAQEKLRSIMLFPVPGAG